MAACSSLFWRCSRLTSGPATLTEEGSKDVGAEDLGLSGGPPLLCCRELQGLGSSPRQEEYASDELPGTGGTSGFPPDAAAFCSFSSPSYSPSSPSES